MKILIIGSRGMLGQALVEVFSHGHEIIGLDREDIDITRGEDSRFKIKHLRPDLIINSAAYTDVDGAEENRELANLINGSAVGYLAQTASELKIPLVHFSTEYVFDGEKQDGYQESDLPAPVSAYGRSKFLGEQELAKHTDKYYLIRLSRLFGKQGLSNGGKKSFVELMLELAKNKSELEVVDEELSCPTYAPDLAARARHIVENNLPFGVYHAANSGAATWHGFASEIFKIKGIGVKLKPVKADHFPRPARRPKYGALLNTKLPQMRDWQEALREFLTSSKL